MMAIQNLLQKTGVAKLLHREQYPEIEFDFSNSDLVEADDFYDVPTKRELPIKGRENLTYRTLDDMSLWMWKRNAYVEHNPYAFGITQQYNTVTPEQFEQTVVAATDESHNRLVLEDPRHLPSISIDEVRDGADPRMAMLYNLMALREDLRTINDLKIPFGSMVKGDLPTPYLRNSTKQNVLDNWFFQNHAALSLLLRSACKGPTSVIDKAIGDMLHGKGAHLGWNSERGNAVFKDGEFEVNL